MPDPSGTPRERRLLAVSDAALGGLLTCCPLMLVAHYVAHDPTMVWACIWTAMLLMVVGVGALLLGPKAPRDSGDGGWDGDDDPPPPLPEPVPVAEKVADYGLAA